MDEAWRIVDPLLREPGAVHLYEPGKLGTGGGGGARCAGGRLGRARPAAMRT